MRINVLFISNKRFFISFKSSSLKPVIYYDFCKKKTCSIMFDALENMYILTRFSG